MNFRNKFRGLREIWQFDNRFRLILTRTFFPRQNLQIYRYKGLEILTDQTAGDANGAREILTSPMYRRFLPLMRLEGAVNVLDLGANNGGFPLLLQSAGVILNKVVSVELNPKTFTRLHFNLKRNLQCSVTALNAALSGVNGSLQVSLGAGSVADNIYESEAGENVDSHTVEGLTVDEICQRYFVNEPIDLCKIDVEGAEFDVFLGSEYQSLRRCRYLIMEIHEREGRRAEEILPSISALGFVRQPAEADADPAVHFFINYEV